MDKSLTCACTAVDPVAVLAVFEDVEADRALYFLVSLFLSCEHLDNLVAGVWRGSPQRWRHLCSLRGGEGARLCRGGRHQEHSGAAQLLNQHQYHLCEILLFKVTSYIYVLLSFLTAPLGGFFVGFVAGLVASLVAKYTSERDEYLKPILNLLFACLAYMITLLFGFSNILGLIAYGIAQTRYGVSNMR